MKKPKFRRAFAAVLLASALGFSACQEVPPRKDEPSEADGRRVLDAKLGPMFEGAPFSVASFKKLAVEKTVLNGMPVTVMSFEADISLPEGWHPECASPGDGFQGWNCSSVSMLGWPAQPKGGHMLLRKSLYFQKTSQGWAGDTLF